MTKKRPIALKLNNSSEKTMHHWADDFIWLTQWYLSECNGLWEDMYGISLATTEKGEWQFSVDIVETPLQGNEFPEIKQILTNGDYIYCYIRENKFNGLSSPSQMLGALPIFREWAEKFVNLSRHQFPIPEDGQLLYWLNQWYTDTLRKFHSLESRIKIHALENPGWNLRVDLQDTGLEEVDFEYIKVERSKNDWYHCFVDNKIFHGPCGPFNFFEVINVFREFVKNSTT